MSRLLWTVALAAIIGTGIGCSGLYDEHHPRVDPTDLSAQEWDYRMLLLFSPSAEDRELHLQRHYLNGHEQAIKDAGIMPMEIIGDGPVHFGPPSSPELDGKALRGRFGVFDETFTAVLVGKDGRPRMRSTDPLTTSQILRAANAPPLEAPPLGANSGVYGVQPEQLARP